MAACSIANIVKSSLGPVGLDKMLVDDVGVSRVYFWCKNSIMYCAFLLAFCCSESTECLSMWPRPPTNNLRTPCELCKNVIVDMMLFTNENIMLIKF